MGVTRRIVFPALRILIWAVIAVALLQLAFGGGSTPTGDPGAGPDEPSAVFEEPQVEVTTATITNQVTLAATIVADGAVTARANLDGTINYFEVDEGALVTEGDRLLVIRQETPRDPVESTDDEGNVTVTPRSPEVTTTVVRAPASGVVRFSVLEDQAVSIGDAVATVTPGTFSVLGSLTPEQQYRLISAPAEGQVEVPGGPAPFTCTGLTTGVAVGADGAPDQQPDGEAQAPTDGTTVQARCSVPAEVTVFPGLTASLVITSGEAADALVLPVTAVQGLFETGVVWVVGPDGEPEERPVTLGLTDGELVQIVDGVAAGDLVLEFVPGAEIEPIDPYAMDPGLG
ncbi:efflux RND transporter periplasmic adaptor subunit [Occultella aeris]|uniref:Multidrug efflux system subunit MdtA n=1 Tax=Occultella aeris TaxID=2761496 RepID=A0A7M4DLQ9_9MICO|nr:secretion protein HlyD [Occultella aeris]VZO38235.1 multidrug efflux system subunit MdtA [Occultella aeris]